MSEQDWTCQKCGAKFKRKPENDSSWIGNAVEFECGTVRAKTGLFEGTECLRRQLAEMTERAEKAEADRDRLAGIVDRFAGYLSSAAYAGVELKANSIVTFWEDTCEAAAKEKA